MPLDSIRVDKKISTRRHWTGVVSAPSIYSDLLVSNPSEKVHPSVVVFSCMIVSEKLGNLFQHYSRFVLDCCWCTVSIRLRDLEDPELRKPRGDTASLSINLGLGLEPQSSQHIHKYNIYIYTYIQYMYDSWPKDHALSPKHVSHHVAILSRKRL